MAHVLLVEPDRILANLYMVGLQTAGHQVTVCTSAQSAIHAADKHKPDVVILELQLIDHSGIEFLYEFRSYPEWQNIPVLVLSNIPMVEFAGSHELLAKELGVDAYFYKPATTTKRLISAVNQVAILA